MARLTFNWGSFLDTVYPDLFPAPTPATGGTQTARGIVAGEEAGSTDVVGYLKRLGLGALEGFLGTAAQEAAGVPEVQQAVQHQAQLEVGKFVTSPAFLIGAAALALGAIILLVKR